VFLSRQVAVQWPGLPHAEAEVQFNAGGVRFFMAKVKHVALIKFKAGTADEQIQKIFDEILDLTETVPGIEDYVSGVNNSPEGLNQGFTHGFVMTFTDAAARDAYLPHPEHERVKTLALPQIESVIVFDFEV
jgi:hypothetical protein